MGNYVADALCETFAADLGIINGGFIRGNRVYETNHAFTLGDIEREFPFQRHPVLVEITGQDIWEALEAGVRGLEERAGFFLHLSKGWSYRFDPKQPPGQRIISVQHNGQEMITEYMRGGGDGFDSLRRGTATKTHFDSLKISEVIARYIADKKEIAPVLEGRVEFAD